MIVLRKIYIIKSRSVVKESRSELQRRAREGEQCDEIGRAV